MVHLPYIDHGAVPGVQKKGFPIDMKLHPTLYQVHELDLIVPVGEGAHIHIFGQVSRPYVKRDPRGIVGDGL